MKVRVGGSVISPDNEPIVIMFENDEERKAFTKQLRRMPVAKGPRAYAQYPSGCTLIVRQYLEESLKMAGYVE